MTFDEIILKFALTNEYNLIKVEMGDIQSVIVQ